MTILDFPKNKVYIDPDGSLEGWGRLAETSNKKQFLFAKYDQEKSSQWFIILDKDAEGLYNLVAGVRVGEFNKNFISIVTDISVQTRALVPHLTEDLKEAFYSIVVEKFVKEGFDGKKPVIEKYYSDETIHFYIDDPEKMKEYKEKFPDHLYWGQYSHKSKHEDFFPEDSYVNTAHIVSQFDELTRGVETSEAGEKKFRYDFIVARKECINSQNQAEYWIALYEQTALSISEPLQLVYAIWVNVETYYAINKIILRNPENINRIIDYIINETMENKESRNIHYYSPDDSQYEKRYEELSNSSEM